MEASLRSTGTRQGADGDGDDGAGTRLHCAARPGTGASSYRVPDVLLPPWVALHNTSPLFPGDNTATSHVRPQSLFLQHHLGLMRVAARTPMSSNTQGIASVFLGKCNGLPHAQHYGSCDRYTLAPCCQTRVRSQHPRPSLDAQELHRNLTSRVWIGADSAA